MTDSIPNMPEKGEVWRHSKKGSVYRIEGISRVEERQGHYLVHYKEADGPQAASPIGWSRPLEEWHQLVELPNGAKAPRFVLETRPSSAASGYEDSWLAREIRTDADALAFATAYRASITFRTMEEAVAAGGGPVVVTTSAARLRETSGASVLDAARACQRVLRERRESELHRTRDRIARLNAYLAEVGAGRFPAGGADAHDAP